MASLRKRGLEFGGGVVLRSSQSPDGSWVAWIERDGDPVMLDPGKPRLFEGATSYQAQCQAIKWLREADMVTAHVDSGSSRVAVRRRGAAG